MATEENCCFLSNDRSQYVTGVNNCTQSFTCWCCNSGSANGPDCGPVTTAEDRECTETSICQRNNTSCWRRTGSCKRIYKGKITILTNHDPITHHRQTRIVCTSLWTRKATRSLIFAQETSAIRTFNVYNIRLLNIFRRSEICDFFVLPVDIIISTDFLLQY